MDGKIYTDSKDRRTFLKEMTAYGGALTLGIYASKLGSSPVKAAVPEDWSKVIGINLATLRDEMAKDVEATLAKVADIGYKAVAPLGFYGMDPKQFRAMLDRHGLIAPSIDLAFSTGPDMEKDLEACQILGAKYAEPAAATRDASIALACRFSGCKTTGPSAVAAPAPGAGGGAGAEPPQTEETVKRTASEYNKYGQAGKKFGVKAMFHNHVGHFELLPGSQSTTFDVFLSETDPDLVVMELDIGSTAIAGRNIPEAIKKYPGRFPVWDIRDAFGIKSADTNPSATPNKRQRYTYAVPVGIGEVDFKALFQSGELAGLKYPSVAQGNTSTWGDSIAAARVSYQNLLKMLT